MTYDEFTAYLAKYGFTPCPITNEQFDGLKAEGFHDDDFYGLACDVLAGVDFNVAVKMNNRNHYRKADA